MSAHGFRGVVPSWQGQFCEEEGAAVYTAVAKKKSVAQVRGRINLVTSVRQLATYFHVCRPHMLKLPQQPRPQPPMCWERSIQTVAWGGRGHFRFKLQHLPDFTMVISEIRSKEKMHDCTSTLNTEQLCLLG